MESTEKYIYLNQKLMGLDGNLGRSLLKYIREEAMLLGTKKGCGEGDCGACTVLIGEKRNGRIQYREAASCVYPLGNAIGTHVVTIEGVNKDKGLTPIQKIIADENACQCGFCTPGIIMTLTCYLIHYDKKYEKTEEEVLGGHVCRCTGYGSIKRAFQRIQKEFFYLKEKKDIIKELVEKEVIPQYFLLIRDRLLEQQSVHSVEIKNKTIIAGGTDFLVKELEEKKEAVFIKNLYDFQGIYKDIDYLSIGSGVTTEELFENHEFTSLINGLEKYRLRISSPQIREIGTIGGNLCNASPSGDLSVIFLSLNTILSTNFNREILLKDFFIDYKKTALMKNEAIVRIKVPIDWKGYGFCFEKISRRQDLDIAAVSISIVYKTEVTGEDIYMADFGMTVGGCAGIPLFLKKSSCFLKGKKISQENIYDLLEMIQEEITPISDVRGSAGYRRLAVKQITKACFQEILPEFLLKV